METEGSRTHHPQRVNTRHSLVLVYHKSLGMWECVMITLDGKISKNYARRVAFLHDVNDACKRMKIPFSTFRTVSMSAVKKSNHSTWDGYILAVWHAGNTQNNDN